MLVNAEQNFPEIISGLFEDLGGVSASIFEIFDEGGDVVFYFRVVLDTVSNLLLVGGQHIYANNNNWAALINLIIKDPIRQKNKIQQMKIQESYQQHPSIPSKIMNPHKRKNFFVFQPTQFDIQDKNGSLSVYNHDSLFYTKIKSKNPMNFVFNSKVLENSLIEEERRPIKTQKKKSIDISSCLVSTATKISTKKERKQMRQEIENQFSDKVIKIEIKPSANHQTQRVKSFVRKFGEKKQIKPHRKTSKHRSVECIEFPQIEKTENSEELQNLSTKLNKSKQTFKQPNLYIKIKTNSKERLTQNFQRKKHTYKNYPSSLFEPFPSLYKGYLSYEQGAKQFLDQSIENINKKNNKKFTYVQVTARNYLVVDRNLNILTQNKADQLIEVASLTKIMTCYLSLLVCKKYLIDFQNYFVRVSEKAAQMPGTTAELQAGDIISIKELMYGLMLPSGNDASVALAEAIGKIIQKHKKKGTKKSYYQTFIGHMNLLAKQLQIEQQYQNSSGLSQFPNFSTPKALAILTTVALRNRHFSNITNTKDYQCEIKNERYGLTRKQRWRNTNKLLWKGWDGVKTGTTETAGHCLMSYKQNMLIGVYDCQTLNKRFTDSVKLYQKFKKDENID